MEKVRRTQGREREERWDGMGWIFEESVYLGEKEREQTR